MPELPEVETVRRGLQSHIKGISIERVVIRQSKLRWPVPDNLDNLLRHQSVNDITRRGKYLLFHCTQGTLIIHLGMSGSLRIVPFDTPALKHDHVDIQLSSKSWLRYNDPRRFGAILWTENNPSSHPLLRHLGIEPLDDAFTGAYLHAVALRHQVPIKTFIMNSHVVTGIGNIYATEALFLAKIHPKTPVAVLSLLQCDTLVNTIKSVLNAALHQGGTTLKDFVNSEGKPGYFSQQLHVYGRMNQPCRVCRTPLVSLKLAQRSTVFCPLCQPLHAKFSKTRNQ